MRSSPPRHPDDPKAAPSELEGVITDAGALAPGDRLVYPNQGVCAVVGVEVSEIAGQKLELIRMRREEDGATVMVPKGKVPTVGLRRVASAELIDGVFHYLAAQFDDPELDWKVRHRDNADRLVGGGVLGVAEVVKGLHALSRLRPLPTKEREQYDNARHLLIGELAASTGVAPGLAEDFIDFALMPPAGTVFKLKPPPKPILMPSRPKKRRLVVDDEGDGLEGLGLDDLAIDLLGDGGEAPPEAGAEGAVEGAVEGAGEGSTEAAEGGDEEEAPPPAKVAPPAKKAKGAESLSDGLAKVLAAARALPTPRAAAKAAPPAKASPPSKVAPRPAPKPAPKPAVAAKAAPAHKKAAAPAKKAPPAKAAKKAEKPAPRKAPAPAKKSAAAKAAGGKKK